MNILVTGATGFTGSYAVPQLLAAGHQVQCFVRTTSDVSKLPTDKVTLAYGDLGDVDSLSQALEDKDALVNIASLGFGHAGGIVTAMQKANVQRAIFVSTTAIFTKLNAPSKKVRMAAEETIQNSGIDYTILRPTMIYGSSHDRNICRLINYLKRFPILPIFGTGEYLLQPIFVGDVAGAIVQALMSPLAIKKSYNISGKHAHSYNQIVDIISQQLDKRIIKWHVSDKLIVGILKQTEKWITLPIKAEQIERLNEDKSFDHSDAEEDFEFSPKPFSAGITIQLEAMR
ncbi:MAG: SDR family oxidoreductase [Anaerolineae bacterium]